MPAVGSPLGGVPIRQTSSSGAVNSDKRSLNQRLETLIRTFFGSGKDLIQLTSQLKDKQQFPSLAEELIKHTGIANNTDTQRVANGIIENLKSAIDLKTVMHQQVGLIKLQQLIKKLGNQARSLSDLEKLEGARVGTGGAPQISVELYDVEVKDLNSLSPRKSLHVVPHQSHNLDPASPAVTEDPSGRVSSDSATEQKKPRGLLSRIGSLFGKGIGKDPDPASGPGEVELDKPQAGAGAEPQAGAGAEPQAGAGAEKPTASLENFPVSIEEWSKANPNKRMEEYRDKVKTSYKSVEPSLGVENSFTSTEQYNDHLKNNHTFFEGLLTQVNNNKKSLKFQKLLDDKGINLTDNIDANSEPKNIIHLILAFLALAQHLHNSSQSLEEIQDNLLKLVGVISFKDKQGDNLRQLSKDVNVQSNENAENDAILDFSHHVLTVISQKKSNDSQPKSLNTSGTLTHQSKTVNFEITYTPNATSDAGPSIIHSPSAGNPVPSDTSSASTGITLDSKTKDEAIKALEEKNTEIENQFKDLEANLKALEQHVLELELELEQLRQQQVAGEDKVKEAQAKEQKIEQLIAQLQKSIQDQNEATQSLDLKLVELEAKESGKLAQAKAEIADYKIPGLEEYQSQAQPVAPAPATAPPAGGAEEEAATGDAATPATAGGAVPPPAQPQAQPVAPAPAAGGAVPPPAQPQAQPVAPAPAQPAAAPPTGVAEEEEATGDAATPATAGGAAATATDQPEDEEDKLSVLYGPADPQANLKELEAKVEIINKNIASIQLLKDCMEKLTQFNDNHQLRLDQLNSKFMEIKSRLEAAEQPQDLHKTLIAQETKIPGSQETITGGRAAAATAEEEAAPPPTTTTTTTGRVPQASASNVADSRGIGGGFGPAGAVQSVSLPANGAGGRGGGFGPAGAVQSVSLPARLGESLPRVITPRKVFVSGVLSPDKPVWIQTSPDALSPRHVVISVPNTRTLYLPLDAQAAAMRTPRSPHGLMGTPPQVRTEANFVMDSHMGPGSIETKIMGILTGMSLFDQGPNGSTILVEYSKDTGEKKWMNTNGVIQYLTEKSRKDLISVYKSLDLKTIVPVKHGFDLITYLDSLSKDATDLKDFGYSISHAPLSLVPSTPGEGNVQDTPSLKRDKTEESPNSAHVQRVGIETPNSRKSGTFAFGTPSKVGFQANQRNPGSGDRSVILDHKLLNKIGAVQSQIGPQPNSRPGAASLSHKGTWAPHK